MRDHLVHRAFAPDCAPLYSLGRNKHSCPARRSSTTPGPFQLREMTGDARLAHAANLLQLRDGKFFLFEKQQQAQPGRIGQKAEQINC